MRVKDEARWLPRLWEGLQAQTISDRCRFVFLDSGSTDNTLAYLRSWDCTVYTIASGEFSFGSTCNLMMELADTDLVAFLSGHVLLERTDTFEILSRFFSDKPNAAGFLRQVPDAARGCTAYERAFLSRRFPGHASSPVPAGWGCAFSNAASIVTRGAWQRLPFPDMAACEDQAWAHDHLARGGRVYYFPDLTVRHSHNESPEDLARRLLYYKRARVGYRAMPMRAVYYFAGVFCETLRCGGGLREAWRYAKSHSGAYLRR